MSKSLKRIDPYKATLINWIVPPPSKDLQSKGCVDTSHFKACCQMLLMHACTAVHFRSNYIGCKVNAWINFMWQLFSSCVYHHSGSFSILNRKYRIVGTQFEVWCGNGPSAIVSLSLSQIGFAAHKDKQDLTKAVPRP